MLSSFGATRHPARDNSRANSSSFNLGIYLNLKSVSQSCFEWLAKRPGAAYPQT
jgi:hypothetical protein